MRADARIAHISDLHFGSRDQAKVWEVLREHLGEV